MNLNNVWELVKINILYSNPQALTNIQKKQAKNPKKNFSAYKSILRQQILMIIFFIFIYAYMFVNIDYRQSQGYFSFQVGMFALIAIVSGFTTLFSVFYDSNDTKLYLPIPVKESEVYLAKILSSQGGSLPFLMPIFALFLIAYLQMTNPFLAVIWTLINFLILVLFTNAISIFLVYFTGQMLMKSPHKKMISTSLMVLSTLLAVGTIFYLSSQSNSRDMTLTTTVQMPLMPYFRGFLEVLINPFSINSLLNYWLGLLGLGALLFLIRQLVITNYFKHFLSMEAAKPIKRVIQRNSKPESLTKTLRRHHLSTIKDGTLIIQTYLMPIILVFAFMGPALTNSRLGLSLITPDFFGIAFLIGTLVGSMLATPTSFLAVAISLEKENYNFLKTLPISFKKFLVGKFLILLVAQLALPLAIYLFAGLFFLKANVLLVLSFLLGAGIAAACLGQLMYWRDYRLLNLTWQNITQLFSRGIGQWFSFILFIGIFVFGVALTVFSIILALHSSVILVSLILVAVILAVIAIIQVIISQNFWKKLP